MVEAMCNEILCATKRRILAVYDDKWELRPRTAWLLNQQGICHPKPEAIDI